MKPIIKNRIERILRKHFLVFNASILSNNSRLSWLGLTDLEKLELMFYLEEDFAIDLRNVSGADLRTVGDVVRCVENRLLLAEVAA
jgi:acyl carrier protein